MRISNWSSDVCSSDLPDSGGRTLRDLRQMTDINALRERVEAAEQRFGLMDEQQRHYSERVIGLIETIETKLQAARSEIEKQIDENLSLSKDLAAARGESAQQLHETKRIGERKSTH